MAGAEDFEASKWEVYKDSFAPPPQTTRRVKAWERASRPASAPRLAGQNIWKRPGMRSQGNKENDEASQLELGKGGAGMRKRAKVDGGKEDIRDAMWMEVSDDIEKVGSKEEKGRESLGRGDLETMSLTARKRTNADHVITPRKPLRKRPSNETNIVLSPAKMVSSPEKPRRRKSVRKSLRRVSVAEKTMGTFKDRKEPLDPAASFDTSYLEVVGGLTATTQEDTPTNHTEESAEGPVPQIAAGESTEDSISNILESEAVDFVSVAVVPEGSETSKKIIPHSTIMEHQARDLTGGLEAVREQILDKPLPPAAEFTSEAQQTSDEAKIKIIVGDQLKSDSPVITITGEDSKMLASPKDEVTVPITITTPARVTRSRRPATELRPSTRTSTRVTRRSLGQPNFSTSGAYSATTSPAKSFRRSTRSPVKRVPLIIQEDAFESQATTQLLSKQQDSRQASSLKTITESVDKDLENKSTETSQIGGPIMGERIEEELAGVEELVIQPLQSLFTQPLDIIETMAVSTVAQEGEASIQTSMEAEVPEGELAEVPREQDSPTAQDDERPSQADTEVETTTETAALSEDPTSSGDDLDELRLQSSENFERISLSLLKTDSTDDATDSDDELSVDLTDNLMIDASIDLAADAAQDEPSANLNEETSDMNFDIATDVAQDVSHEVVHGNFDPDDTDVLLKFLCRVKGEKAAQAEKSAPKRKRSLPHSPIRLSLGEDGVDELASLDVVVKDDFDVSAPKEPSNKRRKTEEPEFDQQDDSPPRRSGRTKTLKSKLPAPSFIPIHRDASVNLKKDVDKELAALTRNNTRKNKGAAVHPQVLLAKKAGGKESPVSRHKALKEVFNEKANRKKGTKPKTVVWAEELAHFQGEDNKEMPVEKREAVVRIEKGEKKLEKKAEPAKETEKDKPDEPTVTFASTPAPASEEKRTPAKKSAIPRVSMKSKIALGMAVNGTPAPKRMMRKRS